MKHTLEMINQMQLDGVIGQYAIGGAVGATFYLEPAATLDIDIFVALPTTAGGALVSLDPIYEYLTARDCPIQHEHVIVGDWPVQFLPAGNRLEEEALAEAVQTEVEGVSAWVMRAEHLVAIALHTGRPKDHVRILQFLETGRVDKDLLSAVISRHGLLPQWQRFRKKYLEE